MFIIGKYYKSFRAKLLKITSLVLNWYYEHAIDKFFLYYLNLQKAIFYQI